MFYTYEKIIEKLELEFKKDKKKLSNGITLYGYIAEHDGWRISIEPFRNSKSHDFSGQQTVPKAYQNVLTQFNGLTLYCQLSLFGIPPLTYKGTSYEEQVYGSLPIGNEEFLDSNYFIFGSSIISEELYGLTYDNEDIVYVFDAITHHLKKTISSIDFLIENSLETVINEYHNNVIHEFE